jgi:heme exporter protein A
MRLAGTGLAAVRGGRRVFDGVSFAVEAGGLLAVTGPNGSGKSTLLRLIAGLVRPASGALSLDPLGEDGLSGQIHYLGHLDALKTVFTVGENLSFWRKIWRAPGLGEAEALDRVGLAALIDLPAGLLSAGQRRRVAIARLLLARRPIWLLDEPTTALDDEAEQNLGRLLAEHLSEGGMVVAATHRALPVTATTALALGQRA